MASRWHSSSPIWNQLQRMQVSSSPSALQSLQSEMNRLFDQWDDEGSTSASRGFPLVSVWEDADALNLECELPGIDQKDLEIYVTGGNQLMIRGELKPQVPEKGIWHRQERPMGKFSRSLTLPFEVDQDKVDARLENGILKLKLTKHEAAKPRKITVKGG